MKGILSGCHRDRTESECGLLGSQNKCTTERGLLSFIYMQSQGNEHPLHDPSRTWPSLKTLQLCGPLNPTAALEDPSFSAEPGLSGLHQACASRHVHVLSSNYLWLFICLAECEEPRKCHWQNSWEEPTSDFPALIWTVTSAAVVSSELRRPCAASAGALTASADASLFAEMSTSDFRSSETNWADTERGNVAPSTEQNIIQLI